MLLTGCTNALHHLVHHPRLLALFYLRFVDLIGISCSFEVTTLGVVDLSPECRDILKMLHKHYDTQRASPQKYCPLAVKRMFELKGLMKLRIG